MDVYQMFRNWKVYIKKGEYGILDENEKTIASKKANTNTLRESYKYTIWIDKGQPLIWVESGYNMPFFISTDKIEKISKELWNTPRPNLMIGNMVMYTHNVIYC